MNTYFLLLVAIVLNHGSALADQNYTVRAGDTILKIADRQLGAPAGKDKRRYALARRILAKNPGLKDGGALTPGQTLILPDGPNAAEPKAAVKEEVASETPVAPTAAAASADLAPAHTAPAEQVVEKAAAPEAAHPEPAHVEPAAHGSHANFLVVQPRVGLADYHTKDKATGVKAELHGQMFSGVAVAYGWALGAHSHLVFEAGASHASVKSVVEDDFTIAKKELWLKNFAVGYETGLTSSLHLHLVAQLNDYLLLGPTEVADNYAPRMVQMPVAEVGLGWNFAHLSSSVLGLSAAAEYVFPGKEGGVKYKTGVEPAAGLYWASERGGHAMNYRVDLKYQPTALKSDFVEQHGTGYGLRLGLIIPL